jgi:quinoprotein glucose dehydrogenase
VIPGLRISSPGTLYNNTLVTQGGEGFVKAWDTVTGEPKWTLTLKAQPGDPAAATWLDDSLKSDYTPGLWGIFTVDTQRGLLFVPVEKVGNDYYGGPHHGNNLYSDSLLAVDVNTGRIKWYQQLVHHDIWDYDPAAQPTLVDVRRSGRTIPGVALITKMGILFVFNRETGEPMYGMEERPVPQTTAKGEWTSPTQPFPMKPPPLARNSLKKEELAKVTPELEGLLCRPLGEVQALRHGAVQPVAREGRHRRISRRDRRRQLAGRDVQSSPRPDDHERHERRPVGSSGRALGAFRAWRPARRARWRRQGRRGRQSRG